MIKDTSSKESSVLQVVVRFIFLTLLRGQPVLKKRQHVIVQVKLHGLPARASAIGSKHLQITRQPIDGMVKALPDAAPKVPNVNTKNSIVFVKAAPYLYK